jgi:hypothetical protein
MEYSKIRIHVLRTSEKQKALFWKAFAAEIAAAKHNCWDQNGDKGNWIVDQLCNEQFSEGVSHDFYPILKKLSKNFPSCYLMVTEFNESEFSQLFICDGVCVDADNFNLRSIPTIGVIRHRATRIQRINDAKKRKAEEQAIENEIAECEQRRLDAERRLSQLKGVFARTSEKPQMIQNSSKIMN